MRHDLFESPATIKAMQIGGRRSYVVDNTLLHLQRGDVIFYTTNSKHFPTDNTHVRLSVTFVDNVGLRPNFVLFEFVVIETDSQAMGHSMTSGQSIAELGGLQWQLQGFDSEDQYKEYERLTERMNAHKGTSLGMKRKHDDFKAQRDAIDPKLRKGEANEI